MSSRPGTTTRCAERSARNSEVDALSHLCDLSDDRGIFEHAEGTAIRREHGYCTDDNARLLLLTATMADVGAAAELSRLALRFVIDAIDSDGKVRNRMDSTGAWTDEGTVDDCWGRALWALGVAAARRPDPELRRVAANAFDCAAQQRSPHSRATAFAAIGAAAILQVNADHTNALALVNGVIDVIGVPMTEEWCWPEQTLRYANATVAQAVLSAGAFLRDPKVIETGLLMLGWLLDSETNSGHLSVVGTSGRSPADGHGPQFDQQPIEVEAMASACAVALEITGEDRWRTGVAMAAAWFNGDNDSGLVMFDSESMGGYDGLLRYVVNINQGAESTLAFVSTMHVAGAVSRASVAGHTVLTQSMARAYASIGAR